MIELTATSPEERQDAVRAFLVRWYGARPTASKPLEADPGCPPPIARWLSVATGDGAWTGAQNRLISPVPLEDDAFILWHPTTPHVADPPGQLWVFYVENQGVVTWACEGRGADPSVWARCDFRPTYTTSWVRETETLSGVLTRAVLLEALRGANCGGVWAPMPRETFERIRRDHALAALPLRAQEAPVSFWPTAYFAANDFIAATFDAEVPGELDVMFGARRESALAFLHDAVDDPDEFGL